MRRLRRWLTVPGIFIPACDHSLTREVPPEFAYTGRLSNSTRAVKLEEFYGS